MLWISFCIVLIVVSLFCFFFGYKREFLYKPQNKEKAWQNRFDTKILQNVKM